MCNKSIILLLIFTIVYVKARTPPYLKTCSRSDPNLNECAKKKAIEAIPYILEGDKQYRISNLKPLKLPKLLIDRHNLNIKFNNISIYGLEEIKINDLDFDLKKMHCELVVGLDHLSLRGTYDIKGRLLILPIRGHGPANITFANTIFKFNFDWILENKRGKEFAKVIDHSIDYNAERVYFHLENLFNGDKQLGTQMNKFLDENWQEVNNDLGPAIAETISTVANSVISNYYEKIPYNELFTP